MNTQYKSLIVESQELCLSDLLNLLEGKLLAIRLPNFASPDCCESWVRSIIGNEFHRYSNAQDFQVSKVGMTYFETENKPNLLDIYFEAAESITSQLHKLFAPLPDPLSLIHKAFGEVWPNHIEVRTLGDRKMCPGILRRIESDNAEGLPPHQDMINKELDNSHQDQLLKCQLANNLYIEVPEEGGELELWNYSPSLEEAAKLYTGRYDFMDRAKLPESIIIKPRRGELIIFRSNLVHAVAGCKNANRTAASCFVGYYGQEHPLYYWS